MASRHVATNFPEQIKETRKRIRDSFKRSHEALQVREAVLLSRVDEVEKEYNSKTEKINKLIESLDKNKSLTSDTLTDNELNETYQQICSVIDTKIKQLTKQTDTSIEFEWDNLFEADIEQLGIINLNSQTVLLPTNIFPPHVKYIIPDYKTKQLPTAYCCKNSKQNSPGELNNPGLLLTILLVPRLAILCSYILNK